MGTRHLICVVKNNEYKVAQYGQWDGYPDGQGLDILKFLSYKPQRELLKRKLDNVRYLDTEDVDKDFIEEYNKLAPKYYGDLETRTPEMIEWAESFMSRDIGSDILGNIASSNKEIILRNSLDFAEDSLFCEWGYVIDFDKNTFEVYRGFNKNPLSKEERFYSGKEGLEYYPIKLIKTYKLNELPSEDEFFKFFTEEDEY